jgi:hypothetical protein
MMQRKGNATSEKVRVVPEKPLRTCRSAGGPTMEMGASA